MAKVTKAEYTEQLTRLREWLPPGSTLYTVLEHVSRSGMQRTIKVLAPVVDQRPCDCHTWPASAPHFIGAPRVDFVHPNYAVSVITGYPRDNGRGREGVKIGGCGMDMGFALVNHVSEKLYGGKHCACGRWWIENQEDDSIAWSIVKGWHAHADRSFFPERDAIELPTPGAWRYEYDPACPKCKGSGNVIGTGYQCLGKGKCPSNYHVNHRDRIRCDGVERDGERIRCARPNDRSFWSGNREEIPADWPMKRIKVGKGRKAEYIDLPLTTLFTPEGEYGREVCPTCKGDGDLPNPDGPERFDLEHFDGYAIRHRWL